MTFFDQVRCPHCRTGFDPEKVTVSGQTIVCPSCGEGLALSDLFGLADAFADPDDDQGPLTLEDAVPRRTAPAAPEGSTALEALRHLKKD